MLPFSISVTMAGWTIEDIDETTQAGRDPTRYH